MSLSNTAVPKYYGQFREMVINGEIPICETIELEMRRIDQLIEDPGIYYDPGPVEGWIAFCENELTTTDGSKLDLLFTFKLWGEQVFGWYYFIERSVYVPRKDNHGGIYKKKRIKRRLINKQYLIVGRGAAKTIYDEAIQAYFLVVDKSTTHQVATAPLMKQAEEVISPLATAIVKKRGPVFKFMTFGNLRNTTGDPMDRAKLVSTKKGIQNFLTNSLLEVRPMKIDSLQGLRCKVATIDEWLSGDTREDVMSALEQGASKFPNWLVVATSSEGTVRNGVGDSIKMELMKILKGEYFNPHVSIFWYKLDDIKEVGQPDLWVKANPNLGYTVEWETYQLEVERAENVPSARNDILAKRFGIPMEGYTYFFPYEETLLHPRRSYWKMPCALGCDLSKGDDFCAFTFFFPLPHGKFGIKCRSYITEKTLNSLQSAAYVKYRQFIDEGTLMVINGKNPAILDMRDVYEDLEQFIIDCHYEVLCVGYDPYGAKEFIEWWERDHGPYGIETVPQGAKTESIPLGELKHLSEMRALLFDEELMKWSMGNCIVLEDNNGNRKLYKLRQEDKIDNVAAMMDGYIAYKRNEEMFE